jgi:hypothetical protein
MLCVKLKQLYTDAMRSVGKKERKKEEYLFIFFIFSFLIFFILQYLYQGWRLASGG